MTPKRLQQLMDRAWDLAQQRAQEEYGIERNDDDEYSNSDHQVVNAIQTRIFEELGGDLEEYSEKCSY